MTPDESVIKLFESSNMAIVRNVVKGKTVLIVSRYAGTIDQVYGVIGFYVGKLLSLCGAKVDYVHSRSTIIPNKKYDIGFLCHYDTDIILRNSFHLLRAVLKNCNHSVFYGNVVPACIGFNKYFVSRQDYLNPNHEVYTRECYSEDRTDNFEKSVYIGRGCDTVLMHPEQTDFTIIVDASRGPPSIKVSTESFQLADFLNANNYDVHVVGFKKRKLFRQTYERVANKIYNRSYIYVSLISGLYELPVIETQSSGNWVISYKDALHSELLCPSTSFKCNTPESLMETIQKIEKIHDPIIPRRFIMDNGFKWTDVVNRMAMHLAV